MPAAARVTSQFYEGATVLFSVLFSCLGCFLGVFGGFCVNFWGVENRVEFSSFPGIYIVGFL
jgi:hypothetical protein